MLTFFKKIYGRICIRFPWFNNLVLYGIFGVSAAVLDYMIFFALSKTDLLHPGIASLIGNICGFFFTFFCNTFFNFKKSTHLFIRFISYFGISAGGMALSTVLIYWAEHTAATNVYLLKAFLVFFVIPAIQFIFNKLITYRDFKE